MISITSSASGSEWELQGQTLQWKCASSCAVVKTAPNEIKTLSRLESIETETRPRHLQVNVKT